MTPLVVSINVRAVSAMVFGAAVLLAGCVLVRSPEAYMLHDGREQLEALAGLVERTAARSDTPWPADGTIGAESVSVYATPSERSREMVLTALGEYRGPFDERSKWFGACLRVTWMAKTRRVEQVSCPARVLHAPQLPVEEELTILDSPTVLPRVTQGPCVPPLSERDYERCGG